MIAKFWIENLVGIPCQVDIASEMRYHRQLARPGTLWISLSQSGETADTLGALRSIQNNEAYCGRIAICNVAESALVRESDFALLTHAGPEIGVASTKAFTTQLVSLLMLVSCLGKRFDLSLENQQRIADALKALPNHIEEVLKLDKAIQELAEQFAQKQHTLFLGRGIHYPVAREGALKLKEISYIHAEAYPAGELKHGPLALVDKKMPVIALLPHNELAEKLKSNLEEVSARGGNVIVFAESDVHLAKNMTVLRTPAVDPILSPIVMTIPLQLLAYHVAILKGTDVDQPRNLAKSVTVE
jgi:glucosamine--fructose-6-phosphate aminotransferase (isomerizing)